MSTSSSRVVAADELRTVLLKHTSSVSAQSVWGTRDGSLAAENVRRVQPTVHVHDGRSPRVDPCLDAHGTLAPAVAGDRRVLRHAGWERCSFAGSSATPSPIAVRGTPPGASRICCRSASGRVGAGHRVDVPDDDAVLWVSQARRRSLPFASGGI